MCIKMSQFLEITENCFTPSVLPTQESIYFFCKHSVHLRTNIQENVILTATKCILKGDSCSVILRSN